VTLDVTDAPLQEVLEQCFKDQPLTFTVQDKAIIVRQRPTQSAPPSLPIPQPPGDIHGHVTDSTGTPLVGANVRIKGTKKGVSTDSKGNFVLPASDAQALILVSFTSYETQEIKVDGRDNINVRLKYSTDPLDEVHVIAYGTTTQRFSVGSIAKVTSEEIASQPVTNVLGALEGRVPGMVVMQSSGAPGASFSVQVRGNNAIGGSSGGPILPSSPLFVIDGVPFAPQNNNINQFNSLVSATNGLGNLFTPGLSPFNNINPADIESIEVLKDAEATSIYGSRGANGVVLITTKKGAIGKARFNLNAYSGENSVTRTVKMMNTSEYLAMRHEAFNNDGLTPSAANQGYDLTTFDTTRYTDWRSVFLGGTAHTTTVNGGLSGGDKNTTFLIGGGFHRVGNVFPGGFHEDGASVNTNIHHSSIDQRFTVDFSNNYSYDENNSAGNPDVLQAFTLAPDYPSLLNPDGSLVWDYKGLDLGQLSGVSNPLSYLKDKYQATTYNLISSLQIGYRVLPGLTIRSSFGYNTFNAKEISESPAVAQDPSYNPVGASNFGTNGYETWIIEPQVEYRAHLLSGKLDVLLGSTFEKDANSASNINASGYTNDDLLGSISAAGQTNAYDSYTEDKYTATFGRINYVLNEKYIISGTGRRDGSSRFGPDRQFGNFGSIGGGWIFSQERFMKPLSRVLSFGKLSANYGSTGSDNIGDYQYQSNWAPQQSSTTYQGIRGYYPENLANPYYNWEVNKKINVGMDLGFAKDRVLLVIDAYRNRCGNQLLPYQLPSQTGFVQVVQNSPATVQNSGVEVQIQSTNIKGREFTWTSSFNISVPRNKLIAYPDLSTSAYANTYKIGQPLSVLQRYIYAGVNDTTGIFQFRTSKGGTTYSPQLSDYGTVGNTDQKFYGGLGNMFKYKGFYLNIFAQFARQTGPNYLFSIYGNLAGSFNYNLPELAVNNHWRQPGDHTVMEKYTTTFGQVYSGARYFTGSSGAYSDASYIRVKTLSLGYDLPHSYLAGIKMEACRIYFSAQNLFTFSRYKGDPETQNMYSIPPAKTITGGLQIIL
jgi:TonB-linked SusC/RagA family outer membrane protein